MAIVRIDIDTLIYRYQQQYHPNSSSQENKDLVAYFNEHYLEFLKDIRMFSYYINSLTYPNKFIFLNKKLKNKFIYYILADNDNPVINNVDYLGNTWEHFEIFCRDENNDSHVFNIFSHIMKHFDVYKNKIDKIVKCIKLENIFRYNSEIKNISKDSISFILNNVSENQVNQFLDNMNKVRQINDYRSSWKNNIIFSKIIRNLAIPNNNNPYIHKACLEILEPARLIKLSKNVKNIGLLSRFVESKFFKEIWCVHYNYNWTRITHELFNKMANPVSILWTYLIT